ncbi:hypothetical protein D778_01520 [Xanthomarina gelatinilytica]|uniref:Uncharacterized protein n=1 Tax=Xanthomarina gelatinilytica TaxID=1137281 RepID=M7MG76_9FLAO|nr:hypothetical protein D778_01520 [Xanthomarina gelatinilytica]
MQLNEKNKRFVDYLLYLYFFPKKSKACIIITFSKLCGYIACIPFLQLDNF